MKGAELVAGSSPMRFRPMGSIDPTVQPVMQMPTSVSPTVAAITPPTTFTADKAPYLAVY